MNEPRFFYLLTLDPATGEELARVQLPEELVAVYALAAGDSELWLLDPGTSGGMAARRLDRLTGTLHESFTVPGVFVVDDADFDAAGRLFLSKREWNPINTAWCTKYWIVPFLGGSPELQFAHHCWTIGEPPLPNLAYFTLADRGAVPIVEVPTLGEVSACVLAALLAMAGVLALRRVGKISAGSA